MPSTNEKLGNPHFYSSSATDEFSKLAEEAQTIRERQRTKVAAAPTRMFYTLIERIKAKLHAFYRRASDTRMVCVPGEGQVRSNDDGTTRREVNVMIDPLLSAAISLQSNKGIYAVLAGSGISRAAGIKTGWEIVEDLITKLAAMQSTVCTPDPATWYQDKYHTEPDYAALLDAIAKSPSERSQLLRRYFEPTASERDHGLKLPTKAHRAIARLVSAGYVRVIVTTNFDRLLERAIEDVGITPTVLSSADAIEGALPLVHSKCCVVKVHGDYLDLRIKNTPAELSTYDPRINRILDQIFDEFGLLVCGWSADWDVALRSAIERCKSRRFTTYWCARGEPTDAAKRLIAHRKAQLIQIDSADSLFGQLAEKVDALERLDSAHPLSARLASELTKKYLVDSRYRIELQDLVLRETETVHAELVDTKFPVQGVAQPAQVLVRIQRYQALTETLVRVLATGCYWGDTQHITMWARCLSRIANPSTTNFGDGGWFYLRQYPALLLLYAGGIAAVAGQKYQVLSALLSPKLTARLPTDAVPLVTVVNPGMVFEDQTARALFPQPAPVSQHLYQVLRQALIDFLPEESLYTWCFDRFECILTLVHKDVGNWPLVLPGWYAWRNKKAWYDLLHEAADRGDAWELIRAGLFGGSLERFQEIEEASRKFLVGNGLLTWPL
jgi:hypothetical protein